MGIRYENARQAIACFHESELAKVFNNVLYARLIARNITKYQAYINRTDSGKYLHIGGIFMENSIQLTQLELVLLQLVAKGKGSWSWYELANSLSRLDVPREPDMMIVLKDLATKGLLERHIQPGSPRDGWELTPAGTKVLSEYQD